MRRWRRHGSNREKEKKDWNNNEQNIKMNGKDKRDRYKLNLKKEMRETKEMWN